MSSFSCPRLSSASPSSANDRKRPFSSSSFSSYATFVVVGLVLLVSLCSQQTLALQDAPASSSSSSNSPPTPLPMMANPVVKVRSSSGGSRRLLQDDGVTDQAEHPLSSALKKLLQLTIRGSRLDGASADKDQTDYLMRDPSEDAFTLSAEKLIDADQAYPQDSTATALLLKRKPSHAGAEQQMSVADWYHMCTFTNVCVAQDGIFFRFQNATRWAWMEAQAVKCQQSEYYWSTPFCHCFHYGFKPYVLPYEYADHVQPNAALDVSKRLYPDPFKFVQAHRHGHYWSVHKWVSHHHLAHWAQKLMVFQSIFQHLPLFRKEIQSTGIDGFVFHDTSNVDPSPLSDHFRAVFDLAMEAALGVKVLSNGENEVDASIDDDVSAAAMGTNFTAAAATAAAGNNLRWAHPILWRSEESKKELGRINTVKNGRILFNEDIQSQKYATSAPPKHAATNIAGENNSTQSSQYTCFSRLSMSPMYGMLNVHSGDMERFRRLVRTRIKSESSIAQSNPHLSRLDSVCPPHRVILLTRDDRRILNSGEIEAFLQKQYGITLEYHAISGRNTSAEQMALFAESGLVLSSHSSQLINVLFSHQSQALVEITPEFHNVDFSAYSHAMGLEFTYALGGTIPVDSKADPNQLPDYTYKADPLMIDCTASLSGICPTGDGRCIRRTISRGTPPSCARINDWPNKPMNFYANITAVQVAVERSITYIQNKCNSVGMQW